MKKGDKVYYKHEQRGGYNYGMIYPAVIVKINPKTVRIRLGRVNTETQKTDAIERNVNPNRLSERRIDCGFESVLTV